MGYRTDLAAEQASLAGGKLPGVTTSREKTNNMAIERVQVEESGAGALGKPAGNYVTISLQPFSKGLRDNREIETVAAEIKKMLPEEGLVLVVGLGNTDITPDAIGPRAAHGIIATRHIDGEYARQNGLEGLRPTAAIAPGVLGQTGMESSEIIASIVKETNPAAVIAIDALAARDTNRLGTTIQISDTGISPGSGVNNRRKELSKATLGVPVIAVGVPTVVDAVTLAYDLLGGEDRVREELERLEPQGKVLMVTPRDIDQLLEHAANLLSKAINLALQPSLSLDDIGFLTN